MSGEDYAGALMSKPMDVASTLRERRQATETPAKIATEELAGQEQEVR